MRSVDWICYWLGGRLSIFRQERGVMAVAGCIHTDANRNNGA